MVNSNNNQSSSPPPFGQGLVEIFTGEGKGKTSAALGTVLRALGHELRVHIMFFMKGSSYPYGERKLLSQLANVSFSTYGQDYFIDPSDIKPHEREEVGQALRKAREIIHSGSYDIVILDEINVAVGWKLVDVSEVVELIKGKPWNVELILTGRYAVPELIEVADQVTEMVKIKHPYDKGIFARRGIDY